MATVDRRYDADRNEVVEDRNTTRENLGALLPLLIIPLLLLGLLWGGAKLLGQQSRNTSQGGGVQYGVGGAPPLSPTISLMPTHIVSPTITPSPTPLNTHKESTSYPTGNPQYGVGGGPGNSAVPSAAPQGGKGGL